MLVEPMPQTKPTRPELVTVATSELRLKLPESGDLTMPGADLVAPAVSCAPKVSKQKAACLTVEETNAVYQNAFDAGQRDFSVIFDLATHNGYDSDHPQAIGDVGKAGVAIDRVEDMTLLFDGIPLDQVSVSIPATGAVIPLLACFIVAGEEQGLDRSQLAGTLKSDILMGHPDRRSFVHPPEPSARIARDVLIFLGRDMPGFQTFSISGKHLHAAGANVVHELGYTLAKGREYLACAHSKKLDVDRIAGHLSFDFANCANAETGAAKLRAAQLIWRRIVKGFNPDQPDSLMLRTECPSLGSLCNEGLAAKLAGDVWQLLKQIDQTGKNADLIIGVGNSQDGAGDVAGNPTVRSVQSARLAQLRETRDQGTCDAALSMVEASANIDKGNLLELAIEALRARASLGEITLTMEKSFGRHRSDAKTQDNIEAVICKGDQRRDTSRGEFEYFAGTGNQWAANKLAGVAARWTPVSEERTRLA